MLITVALERGRTSCGAALGGGAAGSRIGRVAEHLPTEGTSRSWCTLPTLSSRPCARIPGARQEELQVLYLTTRTNWVTPCHVPLRKTLWIMFGPARLARQEGNEGRAVAGRLIDSAAYYAQD